MVMFFFKWGILQSDKKQYTINQFWIPVCTVTCTTFCWFRVLQNLRALVAMNENLKKQEQDFKAHCKEEMTRLKARIEELKEGTEDEDSEDKVGSENQGSACVLVRNLLSWGVQGWKENVGYKMIWQSTVVYGRRIIVNICFMSNRFLNLFLCRFRF